MRKCMLHMAVTARYEKANTVLLPMVQLLEQYLLVLAACGNWLKSRDVKVMEGSTLPPVYVPETNSIDLCA